MGYGDSKRKFSPHLLLALAPGLRLSDMALARSSQEINLTQLLFFVNRLFGFFGPATARAPSPPSATWPPTPIHLAALSLDASYRPASLSANSATVLA
jgi:hypothetical protein